MIFVKRFISFATMVFLGIFVCRTGVAIPAPLCALQAPQDSAKEQEAIDQLRKEGMAAYNEAKYSEAKARWTEALKRARNIKDAVRESRMLINLGLLTWQLRDIEGAVTLFQQGAVVARNLTDPKDWELLPKCLNNLGNIEASELDNYPESYKTYHEAIDFLEPRAMQFPEPSKETLLAKIRVGLIGVCNTLGKDREAKDQANRALEEFAKGTSEDARTGQVSVLLDLGNAYLNEGRLEESESYYLRALKYENVSTVTLDAANIYNNLGNLYLRFGERELNNSHKQAAQERFHQAIAYFQKALDGYRSPQGTALQRATALHNLGNVYFLMADYKKALGYYEEVSQINHTEKATTHDIAQTEFNIGAVYEQMNRLPEALSRYQSTAKIMETLDAKLEAAYVYYSLGALNERLGKTQDAYAAFEKCRFYDELLGDEVDEPSALGAFQTTNIGDMYAREARLLLGMKQPEAALEKLESGRAWGLQRQAARNGAHLAEYLSPADATRLKRAERERDSALAQLAIASSSHKDSTRLLVLFNKAEAAFRTLQQQLENGCPDYLHLRYAPSSTVPELKALAAKNPNTLYVEYAVVDDNTTLLFSLSAKTGIQGLTLPVGRKKLQEQVRRWRETVQAMGALYDPLAPLDQKKAMETRAREEPAIARSLAVSLLSPLEASGLLKADNKEDGRSFTHLVFIGDDVLLDLPFVALIDSAGKRLAERYALSASVSLSLLNWPLSPRIPTGTLLCAADPFGDDNAAYATSTGERLAPLPQMREEGGVIGKMIPGARVYIGRQARKSTLLPLLSNYALLLFATHGKIDNQNGLQSALCLAPESPVGTQAEVLDAQEIMRIPLAARLTVLSACESAQGQLSGGEGCMGLAWAFRAAGCPSIVASLWRVDDLATRELIVAFYKQLKQGIRKDDALCAAMRQLLRNPRYAHPFYWAGFEVIGDTAPLPTESLVQ